MDRRSALRLIAAGAALPIAGCRSRPEEEHRPMSAPTSSLNQASPNRMPVVFLAHGHPFVTKNQTWMDQFHAWGIALPRPRAILVLSAHWVDAPLAIGATETLPLVYDFYGFPAEFYRMTYRAPGAPELAARVRELASKRGPVVDAPGRGLDHGVYVPLMGMYPEADVPVLQVSLPSLEPGAMFELGRSLAPLRDEGFLIMGSGFLTHNMRALDLENKSAPPAWASEFDAWCADVLQRRDADALVAYRERAPGVRMALPTHEHFVPVLATLGAALEHGGDAAFPITGWDAGSFTKRSVQYG
jgi:4,5-DOPA dioxygenase extradiol